MSHPLSIALALLITFAAVGDATAARRVNFSPAEYFCSLAKSFLDAYGARSGRIPKKVARKPRATSAPAVAKAEPAPETPPATVAAITEFAPQPQLPPEAEEITALPIPARCSARSDRRRRRLRPQRLSFRSRSRARSDRHRPRTLPRRPPLLPSSPPPPRMPTSTIRDRQKIFEMREAYRQLAKAEALRQGIPFPLVDAVMNLESGYDASAHGAAGEIGLMQVMPETAAVLGFQGTDVDLQSPPSTSPSAPRISPVPGAWPRRISAPPS